VAPTGNLRQMELRHATVLIAPSSTLPAALEIYFTRTLQVMAGTGQIQSPLPALSRSVAGHKGSHPRVISRPLKFLSGSVIGVAIGAFLGACTTPGNYRDDAAHKELLQTLRQCLVETSISGNRGQDFVSPCVGRDVSSLNGISSRRLIDALGPPRLCLSETETHFPEKDNCPSNQAPLWSFYRHANSIDIGGGPELVCVSTHDPSHCVTVEWRRTK